MKPMHKNIPLSLVIVLMLLLLPGCSAESHAGSGKESYEASKANSIKADRLLSNVDISEQAFCMDGNYVIYTVVLANHNASYWVSEFSVNVIGKASDGSIVFEEERSHHSLFANGTAIIDGRLEVDADISSIEVWPIEDKWKWEEGDISDDWKNENIALSVESTDIKNSEYGNMYTIYGNLENKSNCYIGSRDIKLLLYKETGELLAEGELFSSDDGDFCLYPKTTCSFKVAGEFPPGESEDTTHYKLIVDDISFLPEDINKKAATR